MAFLKATAGTAAILSGVAWGTSSLAVARTISLFPNHSSIGMDAVGWFHAEESASKGYRSQVTPQLIGNWNAFSQGSVLEAGLKADLLLMFTQASEISGAAVKPTPYLELPEAFVGTSPSLLPGVQIHLGRKLEEWSHLDESWNLGIWQPRFRWDYLHPETVGMTGAFLSVQAPLVRIVAWGSPLFIPERGVPMDVQNGAFESDSRWFVPPPSMVSLFGQDTPVRYNLMVPELGSLVNHAGGSLRARVGAVEGPWGSVGYAYKPINQLVLSSDGYLQLSERNEIYADAKIYPRVAYHHLASLEGGFEGEVIDGWFSILSERPNADAVETPPGTRTTQVLKPALAVSSSLDVRVAGGKSDATHLDVSWLRQWGGNAGDQGPQALGGETTSFEARYPFQSAVALGMKSAMFRRLLTTSRVMYDIGHESAVWSTELRYKPHPSWMLGLGADLMSAPDSGGSGDPDGTRLISRYRANDRVHAGVTYVF